MDIRLVKRKKERNRALCIGIKNTLQTLGNIYSLIFMIAYLCSKLITPWQMNETDRVRWVCYCFFPPSTTPLPFPLPLPPLVHFVLNFFQFLLEWTPVCLHEQNKKINSCSLRKKCLPHAQMSGTHNVQHYLDHLAFCGRKILASRMSRHWPVNGVSSYNWEKILHLEHLYHCQTIVWFQLSVRTPERERGREGEREWWGRQWKRTGYWSAGRERK